MAHGADSGGRTLGRQALALPVCLRALLRPSETIEAVRDSTDVRQDGDEGGRDDRIQGDDEGDGHDQLLCSVRERLRRSGNRGRL
jgi:hypothetical protein